MDASAILVCVIAASAIAALPIAPSTITPFLIHEALTLSRSMSALLADKLVMVALFATSSSATTLLNSALSPLRVLTVSFSSMRMPPLTLSSCLSRVATVDTLDVAATSSADALAVSTVLMPPSYVHDADRTQTLCVSPSTSTMDSASSGSRKQQPNSVALKPLNDRPRPPRLLPTEAMVDRSFLARDSAESLENLPPPNRSASILMAMPSLPDGMDASTFSSDLRS